MAAHLLFWSVRGTDLVMLFWGQCSKVAVDDGNYQETSKMLYPLSSGFSFTGKPLRNLKVKIESIWRTGEVTREQEAGGRA